jgi:hypothetical protein
MQLIHLKTGFIVVEYQREKTLFHDPFLQREMKRRGILIPPSMRTEYNGRTVIRLEDADFQRAFKEIYTPAVFNNQMYVWCS